MDAIMNRTLIAATILVILLIPSFAEAQAPTPPDVPTLGPATFFYADASGYSFKILSPQNQSRYSNPIQLNFTIEVTTMLGQFGNVGYSLDGGIITSVSSFVNKTLDKTGIPDWYYWTTTASANVMLPALSEGTHNVTVYYGWQYLGIPENPSLERFEVSSYKTVEFTVGEATGANTQSSPSKSPTSTVPEFPTTILVIIFISIATLLGTVEIKRKQSRRRILQRSFL